MSDPQEQPVSAENLPPTAAPAEPEGVDEPIMPQVRMRIGSQRPGAVKAQAKPQIAFAAPAEPQVKKFPAPNKRNALSPELELELLEAMGDMSLDEMVGDKTAAPKKDVELESKVKAKVVQIHRDDVFVEFGERNQGVLSLRQFAEPPEVGAVLDVVVQSYDPEEGLYQVGKPGAAAAVADWGDLAAGMIVECRVTGHNKGGLECDVNNIRGFMPAGQVSIYRVEDLSTMVGERLTCLVTEARPEKRNLVLSRRAVMEREAAENKERLMKELEVGQIREGTVRSIRDFGAFVDLGGIDGLLHVSQLAWQRVNHPSELLTLNQAVKVKIQKIDPETGKISLAMKDLVESPWTQITSKYPVRSTVEGTVTKVMEFGAFVQLEPGVEGMVHISELAHQRVWRVSDVVAEGQKVEAVVMSVDADKQRISLSIKAAQAKPAPKKAEEAPPEADEPPPPPPKPRKTPLKGGIGSGSGGDAFGLNW